MKTSANIGIRSATQKKLLCRERGSTLIETMIAAIVLVVGVLSLAGTLAVAANDNWNRATALPALPNMPKTRWSN